MADLRFKLCPRCKRLKPVGNGSRLCIECEIERREKLREKRNYAKEYSKRMETEDPKYRRFYRSKEWEMTSKSYRVGVGHRCEECGAPGTDVHHIEPIQTDEGWLRRFDEDNLRLLCVKCHNKAHGRDSFFNT